MRNPGGQITYVNHDGSVEEMDTFTCTHCQHIVNVPTGMSPSNVGGHCKQCDGLICPACTNARECVPFEKWLDAKEGRGTTGFRREMLEREFRARMLRVFPMR